MIRCVRIWTGDDGNSNFEEGLLALPKGGVGDLIGLESPAASVSFRETEAGHALEWHNAPTRQLVITLGGILDFEVYDGRHFTIRPGDVLFAEDTDGSGHVWKLVGDAPWRRAYVILPEGSDPSFLRIRLPAGAKND